MLQISHASHAGAESKAKQSKGTAAAAVAPTATGPGAWEGGEATIDINADLQDADAKSDPTGKSALSGAVPSIHMQCSWALTARHARMHQKGCG